MSFFFSPHFCLLWNLFVLGFTCLHEIAVILTTLRSLSCKWQPGLAFWSIYPWIIVTFLRLSRLGDRGRREVSKGETPSTPKRKTSRLPHHLHDRQQSTAFTALITTCNLTTPDCPFLRKKSEASPPRPGVPGRRGGGRGQPSAGAAPRTGPWPLSRAGPALRQLCPSCWLLLPEPVARCPAALRGCPLPSAIPGHLRPRGRRPLRPAAPLTRPAPPAAPRPPASGEDGAGDAGGSWPASGAARPGTLPQRPQPALGPGCASPATSVEEGEGPGPAPGSAASAGRGGQGGGPAAATSRPGRALPRRVPSRPAWGGGRPPSPRPSRGGGSPTCPRAAGPPPACPACPASASSRQRGGWCAAESLRGFSGGRDFFACLLKRASFLLDEGAELTRPAGGWAGGGSRAGVWATAWPQRQPCPAVGGICRPVCAWMSQAALREASRFKPGSEGFRDGDVKAPRYRTVVKVFLLFHPRLVFTTLSAFRARWRQPGPGGWRGNAEYLPNCGRTYRLGFLDFLLLPTFPNACWRLKPRRVQAVSSGSGD